MMGMFIFSIVKYINSPKEEVSKLFSPGTKWGTAPYILWPDNKFKD